MGATLPMQAFSFDLVEDRKIDFIEQFNEKLLVKQESTNLQVRRRVYTMGRAHGDCNRKSCCCKQLCTHHAEAVSQWSVASGQWSAFEVWSEAAVIPVSIELSPKCQSL